MGYDREYKQGQSAQEPLEVIKKHATDDQANIKSLLTSISLYIQDRSDIKEGKIESETLALPENSSQITPVNDVGDIATEKPVLKTVLGAPSNVLTPNVGNPGERGFSVNLARIRNELKKTDKKAA